MARDLDREARNKALVLEAFDALFNGETLRPPSSTSPPHTSSTAR